MDGKRQMTLGSLFDGSGGFPLGAMISGIRPVWASEIEPFAIAVTRKRLPHVKHYGDVSRLNGAELEPVDIITFGSPCQDMSVAGKRAGLEGSRSSLFYEAIRIIKEMREETNGRYPRFIVWENVPGAFSSNGGEDFKAVLEAVIGIREDGIEVPAPENKRWPYADVLLGDGWSVAYRVLDSQYWGVPQRRRRIYLVSDLGGGRAGEILFKSEGMSGHSPQGGKPWEGAAGGAEESPGEAGGERQWGTGRGGGVVLNDQGGERMDVTNGVTNMLRAQAHHPPMVVDGPAAAGFCTEHSAKSRSIGYGEEKSPTLRAGVVPAALAVENHPADSRVSLSGDGKVQTLTGRMGTGGGNVPMVMESGIRAFGVCSKTSHSMLSDNPHSGFYEAKTSRTLDGKGGNPSCAQGGIAIVAPQGFDRYNGEVTGEVSQTLNAAAGESGNNTPMVFEPKGVAAIEGNGARPSHRGDGYSETETMYTLNATEQHGVAYETDGRYSSSKNSFFTKATKERTDTLLACDYKAPPIVNDGAEPEYIVRRLTPMECARLQGFPDGWCRDIGVDDPAAEDIMFWTDVFETYRLATEPEKRPKTEKQVRKWIADPYTDGAEYRLWGNGISLPIVYFVLCGIAWAAGLED